MEEKVNNVLAICSDADPDLVAEDLLKTGDESLTVNNIFDFPFLFKKSVATFQDCQIENDLDDDELPEILSCRSKVRDSCPRNTFVPNNVVDNCFVSSPSKKMKLHEISDSSDDEIIIADKSKLLTSFCEDNKEKPISLSPATVVLSDDNSSHTNVLSSDVDDNDDDIHYIDIPLFERIDKNSCLNRPSSLSTETLSNTESCSQNSELSKTSKGSQGSKKSRLTEEEKERRKDERERKRIEKENQKLEKERLKLLKQQEKEREKVAKRVLSDLHKNIKPAECMKFVTIILDQLLIEQSMGPALLAAFQSNGINYSVRNVARFTVRWKRSTQDVDPNTKEVLSIERDEPVVLQYVLTDNFVDMVSNDNIVQYVNSIKQKFPGKDVTLIVMGMEKYFRDIKTIDKRLHREAVQTVIGAQDQRKTSQKKLNVGTVISRVKLEEALCELQVQCNCTVQFRESPEEIGKLLVAYSKGVGQTLYKQTRLDNVFSFMPDVVHGSVKIDKEGNGLLKLWRQQIQQFNAVSPEMANAIVKEYQSPQLLIQAYKKSTPREAQLLLQNITVRRNAGVLETNRRIGKELSRKIHELLTINDPTFILK